MFIPYISKPTPVRCCYSYKCTAMSLQIAHILYLQDFDWRASVTIAFSSPLASISFIMSRPPTRDPPTYSAGNVGHLAHSLWACLTTSSSNMSNDFRLSGGTSALRSTSKACLEKPHLGWSMEPFMKRNTGADLTKASSFFSTGSVFGTAAARMSFSSPDSSSSLAMSTPPMNSPLTYSCGYVCQFEWALRPCRTVSSERMSKEAYLAPCLLRICTSWELNPHLGPSGVPLIKIMMGAAFTRAFRRAFSC
mmetsp:Transcript_7531/g.12914  ORF Transcript_7531/g.12914 Transcript_7531/m.12914 type:complete len:250 (+) Transcript_7531:129-878(+)